MPDDVFETVLAIQTRTQSADLVHQPLMFYGAADDKYEFVVIDRLRKIIVGSQFHGLNGALNCSECSDDDNRNIGIDFPDAIEQRHSRQPRHLEIGDDQGRKFDIDAFERPFAAFRGFHPESGIFELCLGYPAKILIVIDNQDMAARHAALSRVPGNTTENVMPPSALGVAFNSPPI